MNHPHALLPAAVALFALAGLALAAPLWAAPGLDTTAPQAAHESAERVVLVTRVLGGALAAGGAALSLAHASKARRSAAPALAVLAAIGVAAAVVAASPWAEGKVRDPVEAAYTGSGFLARFDSVDLAHPPAPDDTMPIFTGSREFPNAAAPMDPGPIHARAGDTWSVWVSVKGRAWEGEAVPTLAVGPEARCEVVEVDDFRDEAWPGIGVRWRCVVLASGEARLQATLPSESEGIGAIHVSVVPSLDLVMMASLTDSLTALALVVAASGLVARAVANRGAPGELRE